MDTRRKHEHLDLCAIPEVEGFVATGLESLQLQVTSIPEVDVDAIDINISFLGRSLRAPLLIGAMTGGTEEAAVLNDRLALAASRLGIGMALGSQRPELAGRAPGYDVRARAPDLPLLLGNLGAVQWLKGVSVVQVSDILRRANVDGVFFHLNPLQEAIQPEGDRDFVGLTAKLAEVVPALKVPVLIKEVGMGLSEPTLQKLAALPIAGVDVAGQGGTSFAYIEGLRAQKQGHRFGNRLGLTFAGVGIPTAQAIPLARRYFPERLVVGSGGVRTGLDMFKCLALGANVVALARPFLMAARESEAAVVELGECLLQELRIAMAITGCRTVADIGLERLLHA